MLLRRKLLFLSIVPLILLCSSLVASVAAASMWSQTYGGTGNDYAYSVVATFDGGYAVAGSTESFGAGGEDFWLVKTDEFGNMEWNQTYGGAEDDVACSLVATSDGGYAIAGSTGSSGAGQADFWLVKTDVFGDMQWNQTYGGAASDIACSLVATSDGGYAIVGYTNSFGAGVYDFWLVKTDAAGNMQWNKTYGGQWGDYPSSVVAASDGGYAIIGLTWSRYDYVIDLTPPEVWLIKTDSLGNMQWNKTYGLGTYYESAYSLVTTSDGGYAIASTTYSIESEQFSYADLFKTDALGNVQWNQTYQEMLNRTPEEPWGEFFSLIATSDGGYAIAGTTSPLGVGDGDFWLVKTDTLGNAEWNQTYGGTAYDVAYSVIEALDGGYALCGATMSFGAGGYDVWLVKTDENGVVPEYSSWLIPALVLTTTAFLIINKKRLLHKRS
jgi:hypothetical protein